MPWVLSVVNGRVSSIPCVVPLPTTLLLLLPVLVRKEERMPALGLVVAMIESDAWQGWRSERLGVDTRINRGRILAHVVPCCNGEDT